MQASVAPPKATILPSTAPDTKTFPRILCLHGGGVNAAIFEAQSRSLIRHLQHSFRLVWADGPFFCDPHPDIVPVYSSYAPFRRWLRWLPEQSEIDAASCIEEIGYSLRAAMTEDDRIGGTGEWVGLMGFSQGAKLSASLLVEQQARENEARKTGTAVQPGLMGSPDPKWRFGILLAGRAPLSNLNPDLLKSNALVSSHGLSEGFQFKEVVEGEAKLRTPTLHVHGMADPGLHLHRRLLHEYCEEGTTALIEWEGAHRIPLMSKDVDRVVNAIYDIAEATGVKVQRTV
ncbi:citrinin biosynthesis oxidoreductase-like protein CtnB [Plenodomus tracheiphilus IPT5]|uniref:Citrinin biosynthesis oxidoreductase-like protein CtnB n=1 Tax=Plenodomus tracheiphilus IPT5 TaxID=1408161 RepID=A0A6A7B5Z3_9PLEO|nr:citrinin biosynthesis oxidoreductase-like protein CtnB [Plenodomus tracheiphilus IPT5]